VSKKLFQQWGPTVAAFKFKNFAYFYPQEIPIKIGINGISSLSPLSETTPWQPDQETSIALDPGNCRVNKG
jgi:hypothetical protein